MLNKLEEGGFYLLKGVATANTLFFEDKEEKLKFQELINFYIGLILLKHDLDFGHLRLCCCFFEQVAFSGFIAQVCCPNKALINAVLFQQ